MLEIHFTITGGVQGVGFRATTHRLAEQLHLKGYVSNLPNGKVEVCIQGSEEEANQLLNALKQTFEIEHVEKSTHPNSKTYQSFEISL